MDDDVRALQGWLGRYSDLHDADVTELVVTPADKFAAVTFTAHEFDSDEMHILRLDLSSVGSIYVVPPPHPEAPGMEDYFFPVSREVDRMEVLLVKIGIHVTIHGTYGWQLQAACASATFILLDRVKS